MAVNDLAASSAPAMLLFIVLLSLLLVYRNFKGGSVPFWVDLLPLLGRSRTKKLPGTAVICGGSVSGILAARVCSDHFEKVILVDSAGQAKSRSYQTDHPHAYLTLMVDVLQRLWPSFLSDAEEAGGVITPADFKITNGGIDIPAPHAKFSSGKVPVTVLLRRKGLDAVLQKLLFETSKTIECYSGIVIKVGSIDPHTRQVNSLVLRDTQGTEETIQDVSLLVDCTGGLQSGIKWLTETGVYLPQDVRLSYDPKARYFTTVFDVPDHVKGRLPIPDGYSQSGCIYGWGVDASLGNTGFLITRMDNDTIMLCCFGWGTYQVPKTVNDIIPHMKSSKGPGKVPVWVFELVELLIREGNPVSKGMRLPSCSNVRYHLAPDVPLNFVAVGDSCMQLNPAYAQGCSKAAIQILALNALLAESSSNLPDYFSKMYFKWTAEYLQPVWEATKAIDYGHRTTTHLSGETEKTGWFIRWYSKQCLLASIDNLNISLALFKVQMFQAPGSSLAAPGVMLPVFWNVLKGCLLSYTLQ